MANELKIRLQPKQSELWNLWSDDETSNIGFGGARGGAKSGGGRRCMLMRRLQYEGTNGLILRRTYTDLYKSHIVKLFEEFPHLQPMWRESHKELRLPGGSKLFMGSAEHEGDMAQFYSAEFADILVDEAQDFSQTELERLAGSNRCTTSELKPKMVFTFMPGFSENGLPPKGLEYLKRVFVTRKLEASERNKRWAFVQAFSWDNVEWVKKELKRDQIDVGTYYSWSDEERREYFLQSEYGLKLAALTDEHLRDAWLYGSWDTFVGQYFPQFSRARHVITKEQLHDRLKPWYKRWMSGDWGYDHPHAVYFHAIDENKKVYTWGELWGRHVSEAELGKRISDRAAGSRFVAFPFSWDAGRQSPRSIRKNPKSIITLLNEALLPGVPRAFPADSSPGSRISRGRLVSQLLDSGYWQICEDCPRLIECLPTLVRDPDSTEQVRKVDYRENSIGDDSYDGASMGLSFMLGSSYKPQEVRLREEAMAITDETERFLFLYKRMQEVNRMPEKEHVVPSWQERLQ